MNAKCAAALVVVNMLGANATLAQEYYRQNAVNGVGGYSSQDARNSGGLGWFSEVADNFPAQAGWAINHVEFWGGYVTGPEAPGHTRGFTVRFYTDNNGRPGTRIYEQDQAAFSETQYYLMPPIPPTFPNGIAGYHYALFLPTPFNVTSTQTLWISVVAILDRGGVGVNEPQWGWVQAVQVSEPPCMQWFFSPGNFTSTGVDEAFVLSHEGPPRCPADVDNGSGTGSPDGGVTIDDLLYYITIFTDGNIAADLDDGSGTGHPDGGVTIDDLLFFVVHFEEGC